MKWKMSNGNEEYWVPQEKRNFLECSVVKYIEWEANISIFGETPQYTMYNDKKTNWTKKCDTKEEAFEWIEARLKKIRKEIDEEFKTILE